MERSPVITLLFKFRITILLSLLAICDIFAIFYAYERTMAKGKLICFLTYYTKYIQSIWQVYSRQLLGRMFCFKS